MTGAEPLGSAGEEAARLLDAVRRWVDDRVIASDMPDADHEHEGAGQQTSSECRYCPLCQAAVALRHHQPEVYEHLNRAADALFAALRAGTAAPAGHSHAGHSHGGQSQTPPDVEHIVIT